MRLNNFLLLLSLLLVPLSGCLGFGDEEGGEPCEEHVHDDGSTHQHGECEGEHGGEHGEGEHGEGGHGNETGGEHGGEEHNETPNVLPTAMLTMTTADGTIIDDFTAIFPGETITFSAVGSEDPDGQVDLIGLTVTDTNNSRTVQLMDNGAFVDETLQFDHVGSVNVTLRVLDNRGEGVVQYYSAAVNNKETHSEEKQYLPEISGCKPEIYASQASLVANQFYTEQEFIVTSGAQWFEVTGSNVGSIHICFGDEELASGSTSASTDQKDWDPSPTSYYAAIYPSGPAVTMNYEIIVHYEDKPAA